MPTTASKPTRSRFISLAEAAEYLSVTDRTVRNFIARGDLPAYRIGSRALRINRDDLDRIITPVTTA